MGLLSIGVRAYQCLRTVAICPTLFYLLKLTHKGQGVTVLHMNAIVLIPLTLYVILCFSTALYHAKRRKIDPFWGTILCFLLSPLLGGLILVFFPERKKNGNKKEV